MLKQVVLFIKNETVRGVYSGVCFREVLRMAVSLAI